MVEQPWDYEGRQRMVTNPKPVAPWGEYAPYVGRMTVEQFEEFPGEEGWIYELHDGRLLIMPGPGISHGKILTRLYRVLDNYLLRHNLGSLIGTTGFNLPLPDNSEEMLCPDLSYVAPERVDALPQRGSYLVGAPDLVIEIASPSDRHPAVANKVAVYLRAGVRLVWVLWPAARTIDVWRGDSPAAPVSTLHVDDMLEGSEVIPGFGCSVRALFEE